MSIELLQVPEDIHLDYSDVYTNKNSRISTTENIHKRPMQCTIIEIKAQRFHSNNILFSLSNQSSLFDLYTLIKVHCYKDVYHIRKPIFTIGKTPIDFIPPQPKNPLACIVHELAVINKNDDILPIPNDPSITIELFMKSYPEFFTKSHGRYTVYILDEYAVQRHANKKSNKWLDIENLIKKYISCAPQR